MDAVHIMHKFGHAINLALSCLSFFLSLPHILAFYVCYHICYSKYIVDVIVSQIQGLNTLSSLKTERIWPGMSDFSDFLRKKYYPAPVTSQYISVLN